MVARFPSFPKKNGKCAKEETAARSFRPEIWRSSADGMKLAPFGRSDSHSVRALRAVKSHPCGAGLHSNGRGAVPMLACWVSGGAAAGTLQFVCFTLRGHRRDAGCEICWCGPTSFAILPRMPVEDLCRRFASPLFVVVVRRRCGGGQVISFLFHVVGIFVSHALRASLMLWFHLMKKRTHI